MTHFRNLLDGSDFPAQAFMQLACPLLAEMLAREGFESLLFDMQHGVMDYADVVAMITAISGTDAVPMVRVPWNDPPTIMRVLDAGAQGIVCPMINSRADAERFVAACRYPPSGIRSIGPTRAAIGNMADYIASAGQSIFTIAMIETQEAMDNLDEIVATPGLDALFPGPGDLAMSYGEPPLVSYEDDIAVARLRRALDAGQAAGLKVVLPGPTAQMAKLAHEWGADWALMGTDWSWALAGARSALEGSRAAARES